MSFQQEKAWKHVHTTHWLAGLFTKLPKERTRLSDARTKVKQHRLLYRPGQPTRALKQTNVESRQNENLKMEHRYFEIQTGWREKDENTSFNPETAKLVDSESNLQLAG